MPIIPIIPINLSIGDSFFIPIKSEPTGYADDTLCLVLSIHNDFPSDLEKELFERRGMLKLIHQYFVIDDSNLLVAYALSDRYEHGTLYQLLIGNKKAFLSIRNRVLYNAWASTLPQSK